MYQLDTTSKQRSRTTHDDRRRRTSVVVCRPWPLFRGRIKVMSTTALHLTLNISKTVKDRGLVPKDHQQEMAYGLSNGHVTDDVT